MSNNALVLFSGGLDSTTCLFYALSKYDKVYTIGFDYGQKHKVELECRQNILSSIKDDKFIADKLVDVKSFGSLAIDPSDPFVPGRNLVFLTYASAYAYLNNCSTIITGVCETDYSCFPDCRRSTMTAMESALSLGLDTAIKIETPLMYLTKAQTWELAERLGGTELIDFIIKNTHTCYNGDHTHLHSWGYGCGECVACELRAKGFIEYKNRK